MDARLRILERQAQASGSAADWKAYAYALQRCLGGQAIDDNVYFWVAIEQSPEDHYWGHKLTVYATETEARGHILNTILDAIGELIYDPDMDEDWFKDYRKWVDLVESGSYDEAWEFYWDTHKGGLIEGAPNEYVDVEREAISRCGPGIPPSHHYIRVG